jgi:Uma2 family endonuclease
MSSEARPGTQDVPIIAIDMPVMYEDEGQDEMGEATEHTDADLILTTGLTAHLADRPTWRVFSNLNWYYHRIDLQAYVSPDVMVVVPSRELPQRLRSYRTAPDCPPPVLCLEILSRRSFQQQDLTNKPRIYAQNGVAEYILIDVTGEFLERRLVLRRRQDDETWVDEQDADGGVTSALGFRIVLEADGLPRVIDARTGRRYRRPKEAEQAQRDAEQAERDAEQARQEAEQARQVAEAAREAVEAEAAARRAAEERSRAEADARRVAEERIRQLEAELAHLRRPPEATP